MPPATIIVISFNRPHYLAQVLDSLRTQHDELAGREVHLFQDGAVNRYSGVRHAEDGEIDACVGLFRAAFPQGTVHRSPDNIGICENVQRAETFAFRGLGAEVAYLFEDDLVLGRWYVETLDRIWERARERPRIGYFAAYGRHDLPLDEQRRQGGDLAPITQNWGFGLSRAHWEGMQPLLEPYLALVVGRDYRQRDHAAIRALFRRSGFYRPETSQDGAKWWATTRLGRWSVTTVACQGRYIGAVGTHFSEELYRARRYDRTVLYPDRLDAIRMPDDVLIGAAVSGEQAGLRLAARAAARQASRERALRGLAPIRRRIARLRGRVE